ncbi:Fusaric acid resistance protein family [Serratia quinivorans]|uniref:FUSC family protein n=1 Tax=Serratia quinivorans TaxID=137545 RepID=UPI00217AF8CC|nr:FUSC family protein [Serratia quinivorans]CAI2045077.1 Fusaric acid resistance protein family [Serratia quinivorans]
MKVGKRQLLHAAKMFISAMLAFALAESIGLQNPYWAMVTSRCFHWPQGPLSPAERPPTVVVCMAC